MQCLDTGHHNPRHPATGHSPALFDHLVSARQHNRRHVEAECLSDLELELIINHKAARALDNLRSQ